MRFIILKGKNEETISGIHTWIITVFFNPTR